MIVGREDEFPGGCSCCRQGWQGVVVVGVNQVVAPMLPQIVQLNLCN